MNDRLDIKKVIEDGSQITSLKSLQQSGVRNVKVLDEQAIQDMIRQAVDEVISTATAEERTQILADSRKQLTKLLSERDEFVSHAGMLEASKNDLIQQVEKLQEEIKLLRKIQDEAPQVDTGRVTELEGENAYLRVEHDKMVEQLDKAMTEIIRLKREIERLQKLLEEQELLRGKLSSAQAHVDELEEQLAAERARSGLAAVKLEELQAASDEAKRTAAAVSDGQAEALEEIVRLEGKFDQEREAARNEKAALEKALKESKQEAERLREEHARWQAEERERLRKKAAEAAEARAAEEAAQREAEAKAAAEAAMKDLEPVEEVVEIPEPTHIPIIVLPSPPRTKPFEGKAGKGLDVGTVNLVAAEQNEQNEVELRLKRNVFIDVEITPYTKSMLTRLNVPYAIQGKRMYVMGEQAFELANVLNRDTRRPMKDGLISPKEQDALPIMKLLIGSILGEPRVPNEVCFYSVPGDPVDSDLSVAYHRDLFDAVLQSLGYKASHVIEGHAVTFAELGDEDFTGIGISCGGGMFNICVAYKSMPALTFSTARSGDWVDMNVAQVLGIKPAKAAQLKEKGLDLLNPKNREEDAVAIYYRNLIKYNVTNIAERFRSADNMPTFKDPISIVFSGGTSMAGNFIELVKTVFKEIEFPIPVKDIRLAKDPLNATAKGALVAAQLEMAHQATQ